MEFNTVHQYRTTEPFPLLDERSGDATSVMYSGGTMPAKIPTSQPTLSVPAQESGGWTVGSATQGSHASHRHTMMFLDSRPPRSDVPVSRPLSMTAVPGFRNLGFQNPQGEYLPQPHMPPPVVQPPKLTQATVVQNGWIQPKPCNDFEHSNPEPDMLDYGHGMLSVDDDTTVIDLRKFTNLGHDHTHELFVDSSRRMSESTNSMSSHGPFADVPHFDDSPPSDHPNQHETDWSGFDTPARSQMDPTASPRPPSLIRSASRSRASPAPNLRTSPYTLESTRNKRWSTGMYPGQPQPRPYQFNRYSSYYGSPLNPQTTFASFGPEHVAPVQSQNYLFPSAQYSTNNSMLYPTSDPYPEAPRPLPSQGLFRLLQSNADRLTGCYSHCSDLSDPPDLYSSLNEKPSDPPEEDMNPSDPEMVPHEQELRFPGDLYTPKWVRGHGNKREGWCGLCKPGRWLVLKNSAFWYDKSFTHGVSAATGAAFQSPQETRRTEGNLDVWEGLCGSCGDWIALVSSKKKGTTWFRHAYKCHTHPKVKDGPKRRREIAVTVTRAPDTTTSSEPLITISSGTPTSSGAEPPMKEARMTSLKDEMDVVKNDSQLLDVKTEDDATPISTPQLTHTSMSTPQLATMHTPSSHYHPTPNERKRFSVLFDPSTFSQSFSTSLEAFAEHESEHLSPHSEVLPSTEPLQESSASSEPMFTLNHDGTFTQNAVFDANTANHYNNHEHMVSDNDHFMSQDDNTNDFFSQHDHHFDFSTPNSQSQDYKITTPLEGNWI